MHGFYFTEKALDYQLNNINDSLIDEKLRQNEMEISSKKSELDKISTELIGLNDKSRNSDIMKIEKRSKVECEQLQKEFLEAQRAEMNFSSSSQSLNDEEIQLKSLINKMKEQ